MKYLLTLFAMTASIGCNSNQQPKGIKMDAFPLIDIDDPSSIVRWESSSFNFAKSKIIIENLRFFHGSLGGTSEKTERPVAIHVCNALLNGVTPEQRAEVDSLVENESEIHAIVCAAIYDYYRKTYLDHKKGLLLGAAMFGVNEDVDNILPSIIAGDELRDIVRIMTVYVHPQYDGVISLGIDFSVPWDEEHGLGLRLQNKEVTAIGTAFTALPKKSN